MKKEILSYLIFFITVGCYSQNIPIEINRSYKSIRTISNKKIDSIALQNAIYLKNDTLIVTSKRIERSYLVNFKNIDSITLNEYKNIVFGEEESRQKYKRKKKTIKRWDSVIKIFFDKNVSQYIRNELTSFFKEINTQIDLINISVVNNKKNSTYYVYTINSKNNTELFPNIKSKNGVAFNMLSNGNNIIYSGALRIDTDKIFNKSEQSYKIKELFIRSLGVFYKSKSLHCDSYFSDCYSTDKKLTKSDINLLKIHYTNNYFDKINYKDFLKILKQYYKSEEKFSSDFIKISI